MGTAELGREIGDAGGPLIVGGIAAALSLAAGLWIPALLVACCAALCLVVLRR